MFQFAHMDWAARVRVKGPHKTSWSAKDLADLAERVPHACKHVVNPQPPKLLHGVMPSEAVQEATEWGNQATQGGAKRHAKLSSISPIIASGIVSLPASMLDQWPAYRDEVVEALCERYGERVRSVVEHLDQDNPHLQFFLVPKAGENFGAVHEGYKARREARLNGPGAKARAAYQDAMREWQDWLFLRVSTRFGLERLGPQRKRVSRKAHQINKKSPSPSVVEQSL